MMQAYAEYKDSGVDWIGECPKHWELLPVRASFSFRNEKNDPVVTEEILSLSIAHGVTRYSEEGRGGNKRKDDLTAYKIARPDDIVLNSMNVIVGAVGRSKYFGAISPVYYALQGRPGIINLDYSEKVFTNPSFQSGLLKLGKGILIKLSGTGQLNTIRMKISQNDLKNVILPSPPPVEQTAIAAFLDDKVGKILELLAIKRRQIELLAERKQILIQNAVTKGLNPDAPVKNSGVDWIGPIPAHWEMKRVKHLLSERNERSENGDEPLLMVSQIHGLVVRADYHSKSEVAATSVGNKIVYENDLVFNKLKPHLGVFFKSKIQDTGIVSPDYAVYVPSGVIPDSRFFEILFRHPAYIGEFIIRATGIVEGLIRLYTSELFDIPVAVPPQNEQQEIIKFCALETKKIDAAIILKRNQITKLNEYKATLINAAVTGKIKVT